MGDLQTLLEKIHETTDFEDVDRMTVNTRGLFENTPLHVVITWKDSNAAELLIASGADINAKGEYGFTPLHRAVSIAHPQLVALLLRSGADPKIKNSDGNDCYELARIKNVSAILNPNSI